MRRIKKIGEPEHFHAWKIGFQRIHGRVPLYDDLQNTREYKKLLEELLKEQGYICCYCEKPIGRGSRMNCNIEHFMPRHPDHKALTQEECDICSNAQLEYKNLFASCLGESSYFTDHCNHKKDNWFDFKLCVSPIDKAISTLFGFRINGKIFAIENNPQGEAMKSHLNLDSYVLCEQRKAAYDTVIDMEFAEDELLTDASYIMDTIAEYDQMDGDGKYVPFCSMITYCLRNEFMG